MNACEMVRQCLQHQPQFYEIEPEDAVRLRPQESDQHSPISQGPGLPTSDEGIEGHIPIPITDSFD